jgi:DnaJ-class molecular chaperone
MSNIIREFGIMGSMWKPGRARAYMKKIPENERCKSCGGSGESMSKHQLIGGYSHVPCHYCGGSGEEKDVPEGLRAF